MKLDTLYMVPGNPNAKQRWRQRHRLFLADGTELRVLLRCSGRVPGLPRVPFGQAAEKQPKPRIEEVDITLLVKDLKVVDKPPRKKA